MLNTLVIFKDEESRKKTTALLAAYYRDQLSVDHSQKPSKVYDLVVLEQSSGTLTEMKSLLEVCSGAKFIVCSRAPLDLSGVSQEYIVENILIACLETDLPKTVKKFEVQGYLIPLEGIQDEYVSVKYEIMLTYCPLDYNVYIKMADGRFVRLFNKGDQVERSDFERYHREKKIGLFYFRKDEYQEVLIRTSKLLDKIANTVPLPEELVVREAKRAHEVVKDVISQMGFTPEAQMIAKSSVAMTAKLMGSKPQLTKILNDLRKKEGNYISSHSVSTGTLACAIAHKMEWNSSATFFKLSLAAFMHDIAISDSLAKYNTLDEVGKAHLSADQANKVKLHPVHATDYVRRMSEIPADVDQIVFQHHERPDGSGFPRGLSGKFITPLSSVFVIAHALVEFIQSREGATVEAFLRETEELYHQGVFRKIWLALKADL